MIPYLALLLIALAFSFIAKAQAKHQLAYGRNEYVRQNNWAVPVFFVFLWLLLACRSIQVGRDLPNYQYLFQKYNNQSFSQIMQADREKLFALLNWLVGNLHGDFQVFLAVIAAMTLVPMAMLYAHDRKHSFLKIVLFVNMPLFAMLFSGIRQSVAIALGALAYRQVKQKRFIRFLITVIIAMAIHESAFMLLAMYPLYYFRFRKKHLLLLVPLLTAVYVFNKPIFSGLLNILSMFGSLYESSIYSSTGAFTTLILFVLFTLFTYIIPDEYDVSDELIGLRNFLLLATALQCFAPLHALAMRMNYYYILFVPLAVTSALDAASPRWAKVARAAETIMCIFFTAYFVITLISSLETGGALDTVPYIPYWEV